MPAVLLQVYLLQTMCDYAQNVWQVLTLGTREHAEAPGIAAWCGLHCVLMHGTGWRDTSLGLATICCLQTQAG